MAYINLFKILWLYSRNDKWKIVLYIVLHALSHVATLATPLVFAQILNSFQLETDNILKTVSFWLAVMVGLFVWFNVLHRIGQYFVFDVAYRAKQAFLNEYYDITTKLPLQWHSDNHSGSTINRINTAANAIHDFGVNQYMYIEYFVLFWGPLIILCTLSWEVALIAFIVAILSIFIMRQFDKKLVVLYRNMNDVQHKISSVFYDYVSNIKTIITLRLGNRTSKEFNNKIEDGYAPYMTAETRVNQTKWLSVSFGVLILEVGVIFYYIWKQVNSGQTILVGNVAAVFQYLQQVSKTYMNIAANYQQILMWQTDLEAVEPIRENFKETSSHTVDIPIWGKIHISDLSFKYDEENQTLDNIEVELSKGEKIALVGESGSGKSSLMAVLRGLYTPQSYKIFIDDNQYDELSILYRTTTLIPQEPEIFENTIEYNISVGLDYPQDEVKKAIKLSSFDKVLDKLPKGLLTDVREKGVSLSGGEKQRLALARGILAAQNSSIILMDEPTSSVDSQNENEIYKNIFEEFKDTTIISSIHRLNLLNKFDRVIVMKEGKIVQEGSFDNLIQEPGLMKDIWKNYLESNTNK